MSHLDTIATRQRRTLFRDIVFAVSIALATLVSAASIGTAVHASRPHLTQR